MCLRQHSTAMEAASGSAAPHAGNDELNNQEGLHRILDDLHLPEAIEQTLHANGIACHRRLCLCI